MKDLSIVIVNWNSQEVVTECLASIYRNLNDIQFEVIVVDNNSSDNGVNVIKNRYTKVKLIENAVNVGFGKANNQGLKISKGKFVLLLNPDAVIQNRAIQNMLAFMQNDESIGAVGPKIVDDNNAVRPEGARNYLTLAGELAQLAKWDRLRRKNSVNKFRNQLQEVEALSGSCMLMRKACLDQIGGFDEQFFLYAEDVDLCYRIKQSGWKVYYFPDATVRHRAHQSSAKAADFSPFAVSCASSYKYFKKNRGFGVAILYRALVFLTSLIWIILYIVTLRFLSGKPLRKLSLYHDYCKLKWALTSRITNVPH
jgi:hypothetical protein